MNSTLSTFFLNAAGTGVSIFAVFCDAISGIVDSYMCEEGRCAGALLRSQIRGTDEERSWDQEKRGL